ncbi:hypothetical protein HID58_072808 [Brassica napus]|uniref:Uncharacterized protein n=1 Tax=Brassica napus TaxID=3708 RepID=A0ABQ7Z5G3_BRANA|nr:hypothetical protein HID58_072808 [Brassica napus]
MRLVLLLFVFSTDAFLLGNTIQATFFRDLDASTEMPLEECHCYEIKNFILTTPSESLRLTKNRYHIKLNKTSIIAMINPFLKSNYYCFPKFDDLYRGFAHPKFSIGVVVGVGFLEEYMTEPTNGNNGFINHKILTLSLSVLLMEHLLMFSKTYGILQMQILSSVCYNFGKLIGRLKHVTNVTNIDGFSRIIFEPNDVPEIDDFRKRIANHEF